MDDIKTMRNDELIRKYQSVFAGPDGAVVLSDILSMLGYFSNVPDRIDPQRIAVANTIMSRINAFNDEGVTDYVKRIVAGAKAPVIENMED